MKHNLLRTLILSALSVCTVLASVPSFDQQLETLISQAERTPYQVYKTLQKIENGPYQLSNADREKIKAAKKQAYAAMGSFTKARLWVSKHPFLTGTVSAATLTGIAGGLYLWKKKNKDTENNNALTPTINPAGVNFSAETATRSTLRRIPSGTGTPPAHAVVGITPDTGYHGHNVGPINVAEKIRQSLHMGAWGDAHGLEHERELIVQQHGGEKNKSKGITITFDHTVSDDTIMTAQVAEALLENYSGTEVDAMDAIARRFARDGITMVGIGNGCTDGIVELQKQIIRAAWENGTLDPSRNSNITHSDQNECSRLHNLFRSGASSLFTGRGNKKISDDGANIIQFALKYQVPLGRFQVQRKKTNESWYQVAPYLASESTGQLHGGGCGAVMRSAPFGWFYYTDPATAATMAANQAELTAHGTKMSKGACAAFATGIAYGLQGMPVNETVAKMVEVAGRYDTPTATRIQRVAALAQQPGRTSVNHAAVYGKHKGQAAHDFVAACVYALVDAHTNKRTIRDVFSEMNSVPGTDSDSVGSGMGQLLSCHGIPAGVSDAEMTGVQNGSQRNVLAQRIISAVGA